MDLKLNYNCVGEATLIGAEGDSALVPLIKSFAIIYISYQMSFIQLQFRRGNASQWTSANPILADGELAIESDTSKFKIGNGIGSWTLLPYGGLVGPTGAIGSVVPNDISFNGNIFVGRDVSFGGKLTVRNDVSFNTELRVGGNVNIRSGAASTSSGTGALIVAGGVGVGGNLNVALDTSLTSRLNVGGNVLLSSNLVVGVDASFNGNTSVAFLPFYSGNPSVAPALNQLVTKKYVDENGGTILLGVNNTWTGNNTFNGSRFYVGGDASFNGNLVVRGDASFNDNLSVHSDSSFNNRLYVGKQVGVGITANAAYALDVLGNIHLSGSLFLNNKLFSITSADISLNANLMVGADASFNGNVFIAKTLNFKKTVLTGGAVGSPISIVAATPIVEITGTGAPTAYFNLANGSYAGQTLTINSATNGGGGGLYVNATASNIIFNGSVCSQMRFLNAFQTVNLLWSADVNDWIVASFQGVNFSGVSMNFGTYTSGDITLSAAGRVNVSSGVGGMVVGADSSFNGNLSVGGTDSSFNSNLYVGVGKRVGIGRLAGATYALDVGGNINLTGNLFTNGVLFSAFDNSKDISLNANLSVASDSSFNANLYIGRRLTVAGGDVSLNQRLTVGGADSSFNGNLYVGRRLIVDSGDVSLNQRLTVGGADSSFNGNLYVGRRLIVDSGDVSLNQRLTVGGADSSFNGNLYVGGSINSDAYIERFVNVASSSGAYTADFNNGLIIYINAFSGSSTPTLSITNLPTALNQSYVFTVVYSGAATSTYFSSLNINGTSVPVNGSVSLSAATSYYVHQFAIFFTDATTISNNFVVQSFNSSAPLSLVSPSVSGNLAVSGNINLTGGNIYQNGVLFVGGGGGGSVGPSLSLGGNLYVGGDISFGGKLFGISDVSLNANVSVGGNINFRGNLFQNGVLFTGGGGTSGTSLSLSSTTESVSKTTGALIVSGGAGISGNVEVGGNVDIAFNTPSINSTTGSLIVRGGVGITGNIYAGGSLIVSGSIVSPSLTGTPVAPTATGGGAGSTQIATTAYVRGEINSLINGAGPALDTLLELGNALGSDLAFSTTVTNSIATKAPIANPTFTGTVNAPALSVTNSTASTSSGTGALIVSGGAGIGGNLFVGGIVNAGGAMTVTGAGGTLLTFFNTIGRYNSSVVNIDFKYSNGSNMARISVIDTSTPPNGGFGTKMSFNLLNGIAFEEYMNLEYTGLSISSTTASTSSTTGALKVAGGVGIGGNLVVGEDARINGMTIGRGGTNNANNTAIGRSALTSNTTADNCVAVGYASLQYNTIGSDNTALGSFALRNNTIGISNLALGMQALQNNTTGNNITAVGAYSLKNNTTGTENTAVGMQALYSNTTGSNNTAVGLSALYYLVDKIRNTAIGNGAGIGGDSTFNGNYNTFIGANTFQEGTGNYNTYLGYGAYSNGTHGNSTSIGVGSVVTASNQIVLGRSTEFVSIPGTAASSSTTTGALRVVGGVGIGGSVHIGGWLNSPSVNGATFAGSVNALSFTVTSDYRVKQNARSILEDASFNVDVLRPITYTNSRAGKPDIGFIAHEVGEHYPYLVNGEKDGEDMQSLNYIGIIGILVKEIQELKGRVAVLENPVNKSLP